MKMKSEKCEDEKMQDKKTNIDIITCTATCCTERFPGIALCTLKKQIKKFVIPKMRITKPAEVERGLLARGLLNIKK